MHRSLVMFVVATTLTGCGGRFSMGSSAQACFDDEAPSVGRRGIDETYGFLRRERDRSRREPSTVLGAQIFEALPSLILDASDVLTEPSCAPELVDQIDDVLERKPVEQSRRLVAQVRAAGRVHDTTDVMERKAAFLMAVLQLTDRELTEYQLAPEERGSRPAKSFVRYLALGYLARSSMFANVPAVGSFLRERLRTSRDDRELLLLAVHVSTMASPAIVTKWIDQAPVRLAGPADPIALEVLLVQLRAIGLAARGEPAQTLLRSIVDARGGFPITSGQPGADRDLVRVAAAALHDSDGETKGWPLEPTPVRARFDPWRDWLDGEPAGGTVSPEAVKRRLADLDGELARMTSSASRCAVLARLAAAVPRGDADVRFEQLVAPVFDGARLRFGRESLCRISAALTLDGVALDRRARFMTRLLAQTSIGPYDGATDDGGFSVLPDAGQVAMLVARQVALHPEWIDQSAELRSVVAAAARQPLGANAGADEMLGVLQPAFERLLAGAERSDGIAIATAWIATIRETVTRTDVNYIYGIEAAEARMFTLAELAPSLGLGVEARALFIEIAASPMPSPGHKYVHPEVVRAAQIARVALDSRP